MVQRYNAIYCFQNYYLCPSQLCLNCEQLIGTGLQAEKGGIQIKAIILILIIVDSAYLIPPNRSTVITGNSVDHLSLGELDATFSHLVAPFLRM